MVNLAGLDLNLLKAFDALMRAGSVTGAGKRIGLSQPAMSHALARLRSLFDDPLFVRTTLGMEPTARARRLAIEVDAALDHVRVALDLGQGFDPAASQRTFALGVTEYAEIALVRGLTRAFAERAPKADLRLIHINRHDLSDALMEGRIDLAVGHFKDPQSWMNGEVLFRDPLRLLARPGHPALAGELGLDDYARLSHLLVSPSGDARGAIDRDLERLGVVRRIGLVTGSYLSVPLALGESDLVAAVPGHVAAVLQARCGLGVRDLPFTHKAEESMVWHRREENDPVHVWLRTLLHEVAAEIET